MADTGSPDGIESPCVRICTIHRAAGICVGCFRTTVEIAHWTDMSPETRRVIIADLPSRAGWLTTRRGGRAGRLARG
jgi:predicted Fe-S protein YdhL (DUF1289 family)